MDGFVRGNTCNEGGGTPEGVPAGYMNGDMGLVVPSRAGCIGGIAPPAAKTAGGMA